MIQDGFENDCPDNHFVKSVQKQMFFIIGVSQKFCNRKTPVLESPFNKVAGLKVCNFMIKRLQRRRFPVNIAKFLRTDFSWNISDDCFYQFDKVNPLNTMISY